MADISVGSTNRLGVNASMGDTCTNLNTKAGKIQQCIEDLETLKNQLPNDWEGEDLDMLMAEFEGFKSKLTEIPIVVKSIADWGTSTCGAYMGHASRTADRISQILGM